MHFKNKLREILEPRLSTKEMENCHTKCGFDIEITSLHYDDEIPNFPSHAFGNLKISGSNNNYAKWNKYGECMVGRIRLASFDLVRSNTVLKEEYSSGIIGEALLAGLVVIIVCIIF